jgi:hypothetical protein
MTTQRRAKGGTSPLCPNLDARWEWVMNVMSRKLYPRQKAWHTQEEAGWAPTPLWTRFVEEKIRCPPSRIVQHVASRVTDYAIPASVEYTYGPTAQISR